MIKKILIIILLSFSFYGCEYTPIYSNNNNSNFYIQEITQEGNSEINTLIRNKLKRYQKKNNEKKFIIKNYSSFKKNVQSKNKSGNATQYLLNLEVKFTVKTIDDEKTFIIKEKFVMNNFENEFDEQNYERVTKNSMTELVINKLLIQLTRM